MKNLIYRMFIPNKVLGILVCSTAAILLIYVFSTHKEDTFVAYLSYIYSAYALIVFIIWFVKACKFSNNFIKENSKIYNFHQEHIKEFNKYTLILGLVINLIYGIIKLSTGIYYRSSWFITLASYYLLLCFMKLNLIKNFGSELENQYKKLKHIGITLLVMNVVLLGIIILIITSHQTFHYSGYLIYATALYDFYLIITALVNIKKYRKNAEPLIYASKYVNLTVAMVSMISLEVAMIYTFGNNDTNFKLIMTSLLGLSVTFVNLFMSFMLIIKSKKGLRKM